jgi:uncharacterized protein YndB with AHSA1/START domain
MEDVIEFEVQLQRSTEEAWRLVTDPAALGTWMLGSFEFDAVPGADLVFRTDDLVKRGEVIDVEPRRRFAWRWSDGAETSEVTISLDGDGETCTVRITERLLPPRGWAQPSIPPGRATIP